jgi:hypothetical protein
MATKSSNLLMGTSGWSYHSWRGVFFPHDLPVRRCVSARRAAIFAVHKKNHAYFLLNKTSPATFRYGRERRRLGPGTA